MSIDRHDLPRASKSEAKTERDIALCRALLERREVSPDLAAMILGPFVDGAA